ncbi:MAG: hypothetical protein KAS32_09260 [Candidatus Peribacteraceae bacterium]|nr:hypothetical protein [Candidatus Peribacteraceae bacterium]
MPTYGQTDAVAVELTEALNNFSFNLELTATRRFARKLDYSDLAGIDDPVTVEVIPGDELQDLVGLDHVFDDIYGCHIVLMQNMTDKVDGGLSETQMAAVLRLRSEIIEYLGQTMLACPNAVHPFENAPMVAARHGREGVYDLEKLEQSNIFYSDIIVTYKVVGLRRKT